MGNIVSNPGTPVQLPDNEQNANTAVAPQAIEGVGPAPQESGYGIDPFGTLPTQQTPALPEISPAAPEPPSITPEPPPLPPEPPPISPPEAPVQGSAVVAETLLNQIPDMKQMMKDLEKSGCLLPELNVKATERVDTSPLAALQPQRLKDGGVFFSTPSNEPIKPILPEVQLATTSAGQPKQRAEKGELPLFVLTAVIGLVQSIQGVAQATHFALIRYPLYKQQNATTQLTTTDANAAAIKAAAIGLLAIITALISLMLIVRRTKNHSPLLYVSVMFIILNFFAQNFLRGGDFVSGSPLELPSILSEIISRP